MDDENRAHNIFPLSPEKRNNVFGKEAKAVTSINGAKFSDLAKIYYKCNEVGKNVDSTTCLSVLRMRPMFFSNGNFIFNGHYHFSESGASDNPKIGTTEDWFIINTMVNPSIRHPLHIHLINYQVIAQAQLRKFN